MLNVVKIDSLKIRIPIHKVSLVDHNFASKFQKVYVRTGDIDPNINEEKFKMNITNGIKTRVAILRTLEGEKAEDQLIIQCNAKKLKSRYLEGITIDTIRIVYDYIISLKIVCFTYEDFLDGYVSDIDLCYDVQVSQETMIEANREIFRNIKPSMYKYVDSPFSRKENTGLQFNKRDKATPAKPFCKIYHKTIELKYNSIEFSEEYLSEVNFENIGRLEFCIKNSKHRKYLNQSFRSLKDLLSIQQQELEKIIFSGVLSYIEKKTIIREYKDLSPTDRLILIFINRLITKGSDKEELLSSLNQFEIPQEKSRMKKKLKNLIENVDDNNKLKSNSKSLNFLRALRLDFENQNPEL